MNRIKTYVNNLGRGVRTTVLALAVVFVGAGIAQAATTISTNVSTDGTLAVTGASTLTGLTSMIQASSTRFSVHGTAYFGGTATSTFSSAGALTLVAALSGTSGTFSTTLGVTGVTTLSNSSTTQSATIAGPLWINGNATTTAAGALSLQSTLDVTGNTTLASTTATTMKVGQVGTGMTRIVAGYCVTGSVSILATAGTASSTQTYANCSPFTAAGVAVTLTTADRVFVQATSSLPYYVTLQAASSTANAINVSLVNTSTSTPVAAAVYAFNFWAFQ